MKKIKTIVFPVGGFGTRFLPATKATPKEMLPVAEKPLIQYAFEEAMDAGIEKFIFITGRNKNSIEDHFDHSFELQTVLDEKKKIEMLEKTIGWLPPAGHIIFLRQQKPIGLGHAVLCAERFVGNEPFVVSLADEMCYGKDKNFLRQMIESHSGKKVNILGITEVEKKDVSKYGVVDPGEEVGDLVKIKNMVEKPRVEEAPSNLCSMGKYILQPEIFEYLKETKIGSGGEIQLTDAMKLMMESHDFYGLKFKEERFDCGSVLGYLEANIFYALKDEKIAEGVKKIINKFHGRISGE
ncbi:MAG: UTP--glucose-1-phosphate uridylyltransferase GalU [Rickettsiales bacterium]|jgi:UTP--glucose-1-phosphate uridylyltransferase|nr:UTP--glucose-1-phosphate uridylyltransferase GalU [Rickettsiales bacterium]